MNKNTFFNELKEQSIVKATIVSKYFDAWAKVILSSMRNNTPDGKKIAYIDLFAGPGRYKDGSASTPIHILDKATCNPLMCDSLVCMFNDKDLDFSRTLESEVNSHPGISKLKHRPIIYNEEVGDEIVKMFESLSLVPTLFFVDPWGYKGLSLRLVNSVLKDWGCDCIFFLNYNRISMGITNPFVVEHLNALFGEDRADKLRTKVSLLNPKERELTIVNDLSEALVEMGGRFVLPFAFKNEKGNRTSHYLFFVSKHFKGYEIMKEIMAKESSDQYQGVPSFEYCPATIQQLFLYELFRPLDDLGKLLLEQYKGQTKRMVDIYIEHNVGHRYIKRNYKDVLKTMEINGGIMATPPASKRKKGTFADSTEVTFP